jgi:hypothetical protein
MGLACYDPAAGKRRRVNWYARKYAVGIEQTSLFSPSLEILSKHLRMPVPF